MSCKREFLPVMLNRNNVNVNTLSANILYDNSCTTITTRQHTVKHESSECQWGLLPYTLPSPQWQHTVKHESSECQWGLLP